MSEMVNRVAQAIRDNIQAVLPDGIEIEYDYAARAAIWAMREPTANMRELGSGMHSVDIAAIWIPPADAEVVWRAMIDEALAEDDCS